VVTTFGLFANSKIQADSYPGYASAKLQFKITSSAKQDIEVEARFMSTDPAVKKYNYKKRIFTVKAGTTTINWTIRKITPGTKLVKVYASKTFSPDEFITTLISDTVSAIGPFQWADPAAASTSTKTPTNTTTPAASTTSSQVPVPVVPASPSSTATTSATSSSGDYLSLPGGL
jgi:hypothetical protein